MKPASSCPLLLAVLAMAAAAAAPATAADYVIDTAKSHASINFRIKHLGFSWLTGRFNDFSGTFASYSVGDMIAESLRFRL